MIHRHLLTALHSALSHYLDLANEAEAIAALDATAYGEESTKRTLSKLRTSPPSLRVHAQAGAALPPLVVSQQLSRRVTDRPLGHNASGEETAISKQDARLEVFAKTEEEAELLTDLVARGLQQSRSDFLKNGYLYFTVEGLEELAPHEQLAAEELGLYVRRVSISAMVQEDAARLFPAVPLGPLTIGLNPLGRVRAVTVESL